MGTAGYEDFRGPDKGEVGGSSPPRPTINRQCLSGFLRFWKIISPKNKWICQRFANEPEHPRVGSRQGVETGLRAPGRFEPPFLSKRG
jgi:hypothetical protein